MNKFIKEPITWILIFAGILYTTGIGWGLPGQETWLTDSLAPFHPLMGLTKGFSFGYLNKYPLVHQFILAILNLPVVIIALINSDPSNGLTVFKLVTLLRSVEYTTALILIDRFVSVIMAVGTIYYIYKITLELFSKRAAIFTSLIVLCNGVFCTYSNLAKVEVPYLFWGVVALYFLILTVKHDRTSDYIKTAIFTCLCFGTKDQGYALFVLPFILYLIILPLVNRDKEVSIFKTIFRKKFIVFTAFFTTGTLITQNIILNWEGFIYRFYLLTGWNSQRAKKYTSDLDGITSQIGDSVNQFVSYGSLSLPFLIISLAGLLTTFIIYKKNKNNFLLLLLPLITIISNYIFFLHIIKQSNVRFLLPVTLLLPIYAGFFIDYLLTLKKKLITVSSLSLFSIILIYSFYFSLSAKMNFLDDLRYDAENWINKNIPEKSSIEYYAYLQYLPRLSDKFKTYRVTARPLDIEKRKPDYIILTSHYYIRFFLQIDGLTEKGRVFLTGKRKKFFKSEFVSFYPKLISGRLSYELVADFKREEKWYKKTVYSRISPEKIFIYKLKKTGKK